MRGTHVWVTHCPDYERDGEARQCRHFVTRTTGRGGHDGPEGHGACRLPTHFMCVKWTAVYEGSVDDHGLVLLHRKRRERP